MLVAERQRFPGERYKLLSLYAKLNGYLMPKEIQTVDYR